MMAVKLRSADDPQMIQIRRGNNFFSRVKTLEKEFQFPRVQYKILISQRNADTIEKLEPIGKIKFMSSLRAS